MTCHLFELSLTYLLTLSLHRHGLRYTDPSRSPVGSDRRHRRWSCLHPQNSSGWTVLPSGSTDPSDDRPAPRPAPPVSVYDPHSPTGPHRPRPTEGRRLLRPCGEERRVSTGPTPTSPLSLFLVSVLLVSTSVGSYGPTPSETGKCRPCPR